ncbi:MULTISPECIES: RHS repeat-associated core domain-containing protein [unclassified Pseudomonas]|uniref:RHS repeat-associated core domain-containing protein n=1 Tax=unclassified Pseudomonas TaxID=196821 RepID=UPI000BCF7B1A|nr:MULTISPECIES: RHS repeat-associated core domain-containing protein [unclassified Pseudomonas]PVZ09729.1 RHS repeat-associated protein [Pseudomonas sp. URIL14HWK12:I12]PVZ21515.1 RHS repeat-associated protein [Pseudomonas sp. URIL14HWK12:I10]PVZ30304.1 RHS repeat-associated protein [Pseudomonas sp. URIL14HWK12:I11]SNZ18601.1 RHS repeat-associated core domain-containing protein [Pseudomonas sp. URIL14HWK12:I9]
MSDALFAARMGDDLFHTSFMADLTSGVLELAAYAAVGAAATALAGAAVAAVGLTVLTAGVGACVLGAVVGIAVGVGMSLSGMDTGLTHMCDAIGSGLFPPTVQAHIATGAKKTFTNGKPAARAAGKLGAPQPPAGEAAIKQAEPSYLDIAKSIFSELWQPTVEPAPHPLAVPCDDDKILCEKHPPGTPQYMAQGSSKVSIEGQPAVRSGDKSTCEAIVVDAGNISPNVRIGGPPVTVRPIKSGKTPGIGLALTVLAALRGRPSKFLSKLPCMMLGMVNGFVMSQVTSAITRAISASPNPVHASTGAKVLGDEQELDFSLPSQVPLVWQRFYNSRDERREGLLGAGWSLPWEIGVHSAPLESGGEQWVYTDEQGRPIEMGAIAPGSATYSAGFGLVVRRHENGAMLIEGDDGLYRLFEATPGQPGQMRLTLLGDRNGNRLLPEYDALGRVCALADDSGYWRVEIAFDPVHVRRAASVSQVVDDRRELRVSYRYDAQGDLAEVIDAEGRQCRLFAYDSGRRMIYHRRAEGLECHYQWAEFGDHWRVVRHWTGDGEQYDFHYDLSQRRMQVRDGLGRVSQRQWNAANLITDYHDNLGQHWQFRWDDDNQLTAMLDPQGGEWALAYDAAGNLSERRDPLGRTVSTQWLAHWPLPVSETDAAGQSWRYQYDQRGNLTAETDPLGHSTQYRYDADGLPVEIIDATGKRKVLRWAANHLLAEYTDCSGYSTRYTYDAQGNLAQITDALGERTCLSYDSHGALLSRQLPDGRVERFERDAAGNLLRHIDPAGNVVQLRYNSRGQAQERTDPLGRRQQYQYDAYGRLQRLTNENGEHYGFGWDIGDRIVTQANLDGSRQQFAYNALDQAIQVTWQPRPDASEAPIEHGLERDAAGQLIALHTADGTTRYQLGANGELLEAAFTDPAGNETKAAFTYDALGQLTAQHGAAGNLAFDYDELGNRQRTGLPDGRWLNRLYYGSGHLHQLNLDGQVISDFTRDRLHREVSRTQGALLAHSEYDRCGRLTARTRRPLNTPPQLPALALKHLRWDAADQLVLRHEQRPALDLRQHLHYDASGRIIASQSPLAQEQFAFDPAANLLDPAHPGGYVKHNQLLTWQDRRYRYDGFGRLAEKRSGSQRVQRFEYDAQHRLIAVHDRQGLRETVTRMAYDPLGRRVGKTHSDASGQVLSHTQFQWDGLSLLSEQRHGRVSLYVYEEDSYTPLARIDGQGDQQRIRYYHADLNGMPEELTESDGSPLWSAQYRVWGSTLHEQRDPAFIEEQNLRFQGQYLDRETGLHFNTFRFYDPEVGRFTTPDPIGLAGGVNLYQYAPEPMGWVDPWGWETCRLSAGDKKKMGPAPKMMKNPHRHHIVREKAPKSWTAQNRAFIEDAQKILGKYNIKINEDLRNFTWAQNGAGHHSIAAAKKVFERLSAADKKGLPGVEEALKKMGAAMKRGKFI